MRDYIKRNSRILGGLGATILCCTSAFAQTPPSTGAAVSPLTEVVVTATKREQDVQDVGVTVAVLGAEVLEQQRIRSLGDVAQVVPGLAYTETHLGSPIYTLRGVGFYETSIQAYPDVATYIDQFALPFPDTARLTAFDLERIEVLKGPQGTLFGNNATGGALNFIAAKPRDSFEAGVLLGYGTFNTAEASGHVTGPVTDTLNARFAVEAVRGDEWQESTTRNDELGKTDTTTARLLLDWNPTERFALSFNANGWLDKSDPQAPQFYKSSPQVPAGTTGLGGTFPADAPILLYDVVPTDSRGADWSPDLRPKRDDRFWQVATRIDFELTDDLTLTSLTSYLDLSIDSEINYDGTDLADYHVAGRIATVESFGQELRIENGTSTALHWIIGANYETTDTFDTADIQALESSSAYANGVCCGGYESTQDLENYAVFGNVEYRIADPLTLKAGIRQTTAKAEAISANTEEVERGLQGMPHTITEFFNIVWGSLSFIYPNFVPLESGDNYTIDNRLNPDGTPVDPSTYGTVGPPEGYHGSLSQDSTSWTLGLDYKLSDAVLLYTTIAKGFKAGGFPTVSAAAWSQFEPVVHEELMSYEVGLKSELADSRVTLNAAAFYYDYTDKQTRAKIVDGIFGLIDALVNVPESTIMGAEFELGMRPVEGLTFQLSAAYLDSEIDKYNGVISSAPDPDTGLLVPVTGDYAGVELPFTPEWQLTGAVVYDMAIASGHVISFGMNVSAQAESNSILALSEQDLIDYNLASRAIWGANIGFRDRDDRYTISLWGKNVFDEEYFTQSLLGYDTQIRYAGRPREYGISVAFKM